MTLLDDLKAAKDVVAEAEVTKNVVDSLIELGEGAKEYADLARVQVRESVPELAAKAEEVVAASRRRLPGVAAATVGGVVLAAGVIVGGVLVLKHRGAGDQASENLAMSVPESEDSLAEGEDAEEADEDAEDSVDEAQTSDDAEETDEFRDEAAEDTEDSR